MKKGDKMAVGIVAYGSYVPWHRLGPESKGWTGRGEKAVANYDEDSITMAVAAAINCLKGLDRQTVDALYFACTTSPYKEKSAATLIATAADLGSEITAADFSGSTRGGTIALKAAIDAVKAGSARRVLVAAADVRVGKPSSEFDASIGDGATAFLVGDSGVVAEFEDSYSSARGIHDIWRTDKDGYLQSWEDRWIIEEGKRTPSIPVAEDGRSRSVKSPPRPRS